MTGIYLLLFQHTCDFIVELEARGRASSPICNPLIKRTKLVGQVQTPYSTAMALKRTASNPFRKVDPATVHGATCKRLHSAAFRRFVVPDPPPPAEIPFWSYNRVAKQVSLQSSTHPWAQVTWKRLVQASTRDRDGCFDAFFPSGRLEIEKDMF